MNIVCGFCKKVPNDILECDECGNPYCSKCTVKKNCLTCKNSSFSISKFGQLLIKNIPTKCNQCSNSIPAFLLEKHLLDDCEFNPIVCKVNECKVTLKKFDFIAHMVNKHEDKLIEFLEKPVDNKDPVLSSSLNIPINDFPAEFNGVWPNGNKTYTHFNNDFLTFSCSYPLSGHFSCKVYVKTAQSVGHVVLGFSTTILNIKKGYLGGDLGLGNWGLAGNGSLGEEGVWKSGSPYKQGDVVELTFNKGVIKYSINGVQTNYSYKLKNNPTTVYLSVTSFYQHTTLIII